MTLQLSASMLASLIPVSAPMNSRLAGLKNGTVHQVLLHLGILWQNALSSHKLNISEDMDMVLGALLHNSCTTMALTETLAISAV